MNNNQKKICAIICEYNPLHNGHAYLINKAKELTGCDFVMAIMSGNFTQRAEPAILNKYRRATLALDSNVDIVVQIPTAYACGSSEIFAKAGVSIADSFKNVSHLLFGSECGDLQQLNKCAEFFINEPKEYSNMLKALLKEGNSYNSSRLKVIEKMVELNKLDASFLETVSQPNNILAIEYIKQLKQLKSSIVPVTCKRIGEDYNSKNFNEFASASTIRNLLLGKDIKDTKKAIPEGIYDNYKKAIEKQGIYNLKMFNDFLLMAMRNTTPEQLSNIFEVKDGFEKRLIAMSQKAIDYPSFVESVKTKAISEKKINKIALYNILGINKEIISLLYKKPLPYIKVLASKKPVLNYTQTSSTLLLRSQDTKKLNGKFVDALLSIENKAENIYSYLNNDKIVSLPYLVQAPILI